MAAATLAVTAFAALAEAQDAGKGMTAVQRLQRGLNTFPAMGIQGGADLCSEHVVARFPFSPAPVTRKPVGRAAVQTYIQGCPRSSSVKSHLNF